MPQFGTTNRVGLNVVTESTWGTAPTSPAFTALRITGEGLNYNANFVTSEELRPDRMTADSQKVEHDAGGSINGELTYGTYDSILEGAFLSTWITTGTVKTGTDITLTKTAGTPNTWALGSGATVFTGFAAVGQMIKVVRGAVTFYARVTSVAASAVGILPLTDEPSFASGTSVTVTPLNYIRNGTTRKSFTMQKVFNDLTAVTYQNFLGCRINKWDLELAPGGLVKTSFEVLAKDADMTASQYGSATVAAANTNAVMNAVDNVVGIAFDGDPGGTTYYFQSLKLSLDNQLRQQRAVGYVAPVGIEAGRLKVSGQIEIYFESKAIYDKFRNSTVLSLDFAMRDAAGNTYIVTLPRVKFSKMEIVAGGSDADIFAKADFEVLMDTSATYMAQLSRGT